MASSFFYNKQGEFRLFWFYIPAVLLHGLIAVWRPPVLEIIWDMVFYKGMAYGLHHFSQFRLSDHFSVPPLYPWLISPAFFASDFLTTAFIQNWINPAVYFLGIYPAYYYSRSMLDPRQSALVCLLYVFYPSAVYSQWLMSENLAAPLVMWIMALAVRLLNDESPRMREGTWLGIAVACLALTKVSLLVYCAAVILWIAYRTALRDRYPAPILMAFSLSITIVITVWWLLGYLAYKANSIVYTEFTDLPLHDAISHFFPIFSAQWTGLWIEGGLIVTTLLFAQWALNFFFSKEKDDSFREIVQVVALITFLVVTAISVYNTKRTGITPWSVSLRHIFYVNLISLPVAVASIDRIRSESRTRKIAYCAFLVVAILLCSVSFAAPEAWQKLANSHAFFSNAPSLDFLYQLRKEGALAAWAVLAGISLCLGFSFPYLRRVGVWIVCILMIYIQSAALEQVINNRVRAIRDLYVTELHDFCKQLKLGKWKDITIYCEATDDHPYLATNLNFWVQRSAGNLPPNAPRPSLPYLLLTISPHTDGELVYESGVLKAYLYAKKIQ